MSDSDEAAQAPPNLRGFTLLSELHEFERAVAYARVAELDDNPSLAAGDFDFPHLQRIHQYILQDVYAWAGNMRRAGQDTQAFGMAHCRPENLPGELRQVFGAIARNKPSSTDRDHALTVTADHWGELTARHPFVDGNSRSQRVFFHRYLNAAGWELNWTRIDAAAVHAARHIAMRTVDSTYLAEALRPGIARLGDPPQGSLAATQGHRSERDAVALYDAMNHHKRQGGTAAEFFAEQPTPETPAQRAARIASRGTRRTPPTGSEKIAVSSQPSRGAGSQRDVDRGR